MAVAALLEAVQLDRLVHSGSGTHLGIGTDIQAGAVLGLHRDVPDRQIDDTVACFIIELGPNR